MRSARFFAVFDFCSFLFNVDRAAGKIASNRLSTAPPFSKRRFLPFRRKNFLRSAEKQMNFNRKIETAPEFYRFCSGAPSENLIRFAKFCANRFVAFSRRADEIYLTAF